MNTQQRVDEILAKPTMTVPEYAIVQNISRDHAYALAARGELGVRVLRLGRTLRVPTADVCKQLGIDVPDGGAVPAA